MIKNTSLWRFIFNQWNYNSY